jgi:hypothetical protein
MTHPHSYSAELARQRERMAREQVAGLSLFGEPERRPPLVAPSAEQRALAIEGSPAAGYHRWRNTPEADTVLQTMRIIAREWRAADPERKVGGRSLWEAGRRRWITEGRGAWPDNKIQPDACRELEDTTPDLKGHMRFRVRKEAA